MRSWKVLTFAGIVIALMATSASAQVYFSGGSRWYRHHDDHADFHDELDHRGFHRELYHRDAHRYPMSWRQHEALHDDLDHDAFHDELEHRSYHRRYPTYYYPYGYGYSRPGIGYSGRGYSIWFGW